MNTECCLNRDAMNYLCEFRRILEEMINGMNAACLDGSISHNFIVQMIPHHMAAIQMSENILKYTNVPELRKIAEGIISEQTKSIENMKSILCSCTCAKNSHSELCSFQNRMNIIKETMFQKMKSARGNNNISCNFLREMIPHHKGAVEMSRNTLRFDICPQLKPILDAIISSQCRGIEEMKKLESSLSCSA